MYQIYESTFYFLLDQTLSFVVFLDFLSTPFVILSTFDRRTFTLRQVFISKLVDKLFVHESWMIHGS